LMASLDILLLLGWPPVSLDVLLSLLGIVAWPNFCCASGSPSAYFEPILGPILALFPSYLALSVVGIVVARYIIVVVALATAISLLAQQISSIRL